MGLCRAYARWVRFWHGRSVPYLLARFLVAAFPHPRWCYVTFDGYRLALDLSDVLQVNVALNGVWDPELSRWWAYLTSQAGTVFDVGAHCGYFSLMARRHAPPTAHIYAFESNPRMQKQYQLNIDLNHFDNVHLIPKAVSDGSGTLSFYVRTAFEPGASSRVRVPYTDRLVTVETVALDAYCEESGIRQVDVVKVDIEGGEAQALIGMKDGLRAGRYGILVIEMHPAVLSRDDVAGMARTFHEAGYILFRLRDEIALRLSDDDDLSVGHVQVMAVHPSRLPTLAGSEGGLGLSLPSHYANLYPFPNELV